MWGYVKDVLGELGVHVALGLQVLEVEVEPA